jgi:hypothetical protein
MELIRQATLLPTRKVGIGAGFWGAVLTAGTVAGVNFLAPGIGDTFSGEIAIAIGGFVGWASAFVGSYMTKERK